MIKTFDLTGDSQEFNELKAFLVRNEEISHEIEEKVRNIISDVRINGDQAILKYTKLFDKVDFLEASRLEVSSSEIEEAFDKVDKKLLKVIEKSALNIKLFHENQKTKSWFTTKENGVLLGQLVRPIETVGVYVPGGTAPLPSSVLMNVIPAKVAGVSKIIMVTPPGKDGKINVSILAAAKIAGVDKIYKIGGAQAIAALSYGTETISPVDKITGPGNIFVATAKKQVFGKVGIDMVAGPSEILIIANSSANPSFVAADMLSQAEHDTMAAAVLVTDDKELAGKVKMELETQLMELSRAHIAKKSLSDYGAVVLVKNIEQAFEVANAFAPEHLEICMDNAMNYIDKVKNAGAVFLGHYTPEPVGDYFAGPNHVLPTNGTAKFCSPLNVDDFIKKTSLLSFSKKAFLQVAQDVGTFADAEGLTAHARSARIRQE